MLCVAERSEDVTSVLKFHHKARGSPLAFLTENIIAACRGLGAAVCNLVFPIPTPFSKDSLKPDAPSPLPPQDGVENWRCRKGLKDGLR